MIPLWTVPIEYKDSWCVAGGFAACPALAADIDLWFFGRTDDLIRERAELLAYYKLKITEQNQNRPAWPEKRYRLESQDESREFVAYEGLGCSIKKVGVLYLPRSIGGPLQKPIHVMVTDAGDPGTLLQGFDVSTHAVAIDHNGRVWKHPLWTPPQDRPIAILMNEYTPTRLTRISLRFGHEPDLVETLIENRSNAFGTTDDIPF